MMNHIAMEEEKNGKHSFNLSTHKNGAPPDITDEYKQKHKLNNNCSSPSSTTKQALETTSRMNSNCCYNVPARVVLYFLSWSGFLVSFMMRNDINLALVVMVKSKNATAELNSTKASLGNNLSDEDALAEFDWDSTIKSWILGSFYGMYVVSQVLGGIATQYFGTKTIFGWSQFATAVGSLCIPLAASTHWSLLILVRSVQGFASGLTWPSMYQIVPTWIPPAERSRFMSSFQGFSFGIGLTYPLCGFIIKNFGWRPVFYTTGTIGMLWCIIWYFLAFNTPQEHPRISPQELEYIEMNVSSEIKEHQGMKIPWKSIFTSLPAWAIGVTTFGRIWIHYTFLLMGPNYMKYILNFNIQSNGIISGLPFICSYLASVLFCYVADVLVQQNILSLTNVRKLMTASSQIIPGLLLVLIGYLVEEILTVIIIWSIAVTMITASYAGAMASIVDIAPNLAGPVLAFAQTIHMSASFISPLVNGMILKDQQNLDQWQTCFLLSSAIAIVTYTMFQLYGTADIQSWNYPPVRCDSESAEREDLNHDSSEKLQKKQLQDNQDSDDN